MSNFEGNKDNIWEQGTLENKFVIFGEQGNKQIYFRGTREQVPPWKGLILSPHSGIYDQSSPILVSW